jgi:hypothetical protein
VSEPTYTVIVVTSRFLIVVDASLNRRRILISDRPSLSKGDILTESQINELQ